MAAATTSLPVTLSPRFFDGSAASELHSIRRNEEDLELAGATIRANGRTGHAVLQHSGSSGELDGRMQAVNDLDCVLLWDSGSQVRKRRFCKR